MRITLRFPADTPWSAIAAICEQLTAALETNFPDWQPSFHIEWEDS